MDSERIKEIQAETAYPQSRSVQQALLKVWNECEQKQDRRYSEEEVEDILIEYVKTNPTKPYRVVNWFSNFKRNKI